ncbi:EAL domain-containing protein [Cohaesibacter celericrescens]|uniref:EAL domain-containing protein n=1 Tax=Cohaesibacter celericrescens TaxID=2067669 RepID=A0A2N5XKR2_9HYPH|nr:EAL domain-containing protein [Cohaesibacter celericrescens]PLW75099.1 hypothetical protein C0081_22700 [Cohaesibacter celericrescens]
MQRLGAIFIAICMVAISVSAGAVLYFKFKLSIPEAAPISFGVLLTLLLIHYQISRVRDRMVIDEQMDDLTRLKLGLTKELQDVRELTQRLDGTVSERIEREIEPVLAELDIIGSLVKQLAESCAELDERVLAGDKQVEAVSSKLKSATQSVKELEELLRANARSLSNNRNEPSERQENKNTVADALSAAAQSAPETAPVPEKMPVAQSPAEPEPPIREEDELAVRRALALGKMELFMQPVVSLPMRKPQYYEALTRLKKDDGAFITPDIFLPVCRQNGFLPMLDRLAINEAFRLQRRLSDRGHPVDTFCNLSLQSIADTDFFTLMRDLFEQNKDLAEHVILEISQADFRKFGIMEDETLQLLRSMGFRISVDQITDISVDFDAFARKGVRFAKIAAPILTHQDARKNLDIHPADFSRLLSRKGIELVVTHVETESSLVGLIDYSVHLAQGNHFAPAKPLKSGADEQRAAAQSRVSASPPSPSSDGSRASLQPQSAPAPRVHGLGDRKSDGGDTPVSSNRRLGENPKIAQALRAMAAQDSGDMSTRDHFRNVLAEAAGLVDASEGRPSPTAAAAQGASGLTNHSPASDDYGFKTGIDRGQFVDLSEPTSPVRKQENRRTSASSGPTDASGPDRFERLIR